MARTKIYASDLTRLLDEELGKMSGGRAGGMKRNALANEILKIVFTIPRNFGENGLLLEELRFIAEMEQTIPAEEIKKQADRQCRAPLNQLIWALRQGLRTKL